MNRKYFYPAGIILLAMQVVCAHGTEVAQESANNVSTGMIIETLFALIFVAALIFGATWLIRRMGQRIHSKRPGKRVKIQSVFSLGSRERLIVVEIEGHRLLLGVTSSNISLIKELSAQSSDHDEQEKPATSETRLFQRLLKGSKKIQ